MRQVPHYLIIGNGRVARHFCHYLSLLNMAVSQWHRAMPAARLKEMLPAATHILVLISDSAIEPFIEGNLKETAAVKIHFSGALSSKLAQGAHPLMTFGQNLYALEKYQSIPFVVDAKDFVLPALPNRHVFLAPEMKAKYHALCVLAGNFSCLLWQKFFSTLESEFHLPPDIGQPYLRQQTENLLTDYKTALTGPLSRGDEVTIQKNIAALEGDPFQRVYQSFVDAYKEKTS